MKKHFIVPLLCVASTAHALGVGVNMENLEMHYEIASMSPPWGSVVHQYKSRNTYQNSLGVGWCNAIHVKTPKGELHFDLESRAVIEKDAITIENCGTRKRFGDAIRYEPDPSIQSKLAGNTLQALAATGMEIQLTNPETRKIVQLSQTGIAVWDQMYGWDGRLVSAGGIRVETDEQGRVVKLAGPDDQNVTFSYDGKRLKQIKGPAGIEANFGYQGSQLSKIDNAWKKTYSFVYSEGFNLQNVVYPDQSKFTFFYDEPRDVITGLLNRNGCMETYSHIAGQDKDHYKVQSTLMCNGKKKNERTLTLVYGENGYLKERRDVTLDENGQEVKKMDYPDH